MKVKFLTVVQKIEVLLGSHACSPKEVLDDEYRNFFIHGDHERTPHSGFNI
jgi:hypothetical protein